MCTLHTWLVGQLTHRATGNPLRVQGNEEQARASAGGKEKLDPRQIDAFWLQRELSKFYDDAMTSLKRAQEILDVLEEGTSERDIENKLALLLGYERFDFVKLLRKNRLTGVRISTD